MSRLFAIDLQLTTLEFHGLVSALRRYVADVSNKSSCQLREDEMTCAKYAAKITPAQRLMWEARYQRELKRNLSALNRPRYSYKSDWQLVLVLFRLLVNDWEIDTPGMALKARLAHLQINASRQQSGHWITQNASTTGVAVSIVDHHLWLTSTMTESESQWEPK